MACLKFRTRDMVVWCKMPHFFGRIPVSPSRTSLQTIQNIIADMLLVFFLVCVLFTRLVPLFVCLAGWLVGWTSKSIMNV